MSWRLDFAVCHWHSGWGQRGCNDLWRERGMGSVGLGQLRIWGPREGDGKSLARDRERWRDRETGSTEQREGSGSELCPRRVFIHSEISSLTWAQQEVTGTCLITRHSGDSNLVSFLNGSLVLEPHGRQNEQLHSDSTWFCLTSPSCPCCADVVSLNLMQWTL